MGIVEETEFNMKKAVEHLRDEFRSLRTNRVSPQILDSIKVDVYGSEMRLCSLCNISVHGRQLMLRLFDASNGTSVVKAIQSSDLALQPILEGGLVRVPVPPLNQEIREGVVKVAKTKSEDAKVAIRQHRKKANEIIRKEKSEGLIVEDEQRSYEKKVQGLTDQYCKEIDQIFSEKQEEILSI